MLLLGPAQGPGDRPVARLLAALPTDAAPDDAPRYRTSAGPRPGGRRAWAGTRPPSTPSRPRPRPARRQQRPARPGVHGGRAACCRASRETVRGAAPAGRAGEPEDQDWRRSTTWATPSDDDRVFTWYDATGEIRFGPRVRLRTDGSRQHGAVPAPDARINDRLPVRRRPARQRPGRHPHRPSHLHPVRRRGDQPRAAVGGVDAETIENVKIRGPLRLRGGERAVTAEDFERLARRRPRPSVGPTASPCPTTRPRFGCSWCPRRRNRPDARPREPGAARAAGQRADRLSGPATAVDLPRAAR